MDELEDDTYTCTRCKQEVKESDSFCMYCGTLFEEDVFCLNHPAEEAEAACVICGNAFCNACGSRVSNLFLCDQHVCYEIYEGMARIYGVSDAGSAEYASNCLQQAGLHSFVYARKITPGPEYTVFRATGGYDGHIINEFKVMLPCHEVLRAEAVLRELEITQ